MLEFNNLDEMKPYFNSELCRYTFPSNIKINFDLKTDASIECHNVTAGNISCYCIDADNIVADTIESLYVTARSLDVKYRLKASIVKVGIIEEWQQKYL